MIELLDLERFRQRRSDFDRAVASCPDIDRFCSSSHWILPAHDALMPPREAVIVQDGDAWITLASSRDPRGFTILEPMEASWGLASPVIGASPTLLLELLEAREWGLFLLAGVYDGTPTRSQLLEVLGARFDILEGTTTTRYVVDLTRGVDDFLARRSRNFRRSLRRARQRTREEQIVFEVADDLDPHVALARIEAVDRRSWKGLSGHGLASTGLLGFYRHMLPSLAEQRALRLLFATRDGVDVAFIVGGVFGNTYRGCQFGYDEELSEIGLGNVCQIEQMNALVVEGIEHYDLGTTSEHYKRRWSDRVIESSLALIVNTP